MIKNKKSKNQIKIEEEIDRIRKKFGMTPLGSQRSYEQRLEDYQNNKDKNNGKRT